MRFFRLVIIVGVVACLPSVVPSMAAQPEVEEQVDEFIPLDQLPPQDQLPAAPLLVSAYVFALVALFGYLWSVARRVQAVADDVSRLEHDLKDRDRSP